MRILVPVDGSGSANRAMTYAVSLVDGPPDGEITLLNVPNQGTLDTSDISSVVSVGADTGARRRPLRTPPRDSPLQ